MAPFRHILVGTDFSEPAERALDLAVDLAIKFDAKLTLLHVFAFPQVDYGFMGYYPDKEYLASAQKRLDEVLAREQTRLPAITGALVEGEPCIQILYAVERRQIGLIAIGTHGRNWISRTLLGSVADKVVRTSSVPVLAVPAFSLKKPHALTAAEVGREDWS